MQPFTYSVSKGLRAGAIGGFIGSIVLGILGELGAIAMNQELFYTTIAKRMGFGDSSVLGGWTLHFLVGIIAGSLFLGATAAIRRFALTTTKKAIWVGVLGGIAIWIVFYVPVTGILLPEDLTYTTFRRIPCAPRALRDCDWDCVPLSSASNSQDENNHLVKFQSNMREFASQGSRWDNENSLTILDESDSQEYCQEDCEYCVGKSFPQKLLQPEFGRRTYRFAFVSPYYPSGK